MDTSRLNGNRHSAKQSTQAVDLCWDPLTVKFSNVFSRIISKAVVSEPWPNFVNRFCLNCHNCSLFVGSQDRIESTPQSRTTSAIETGLCSSNGIIINGALFLVNYWSRNPRDLCLFRCCVTPLSSCCHSRGKVLTHTSTQSLFIATKRIFR